VLYLMATQVILPGFISAIVYPARPSYFLIDAMVACVPLAWGGFVGAWVLSELVWCKFMAISTATFLWLAVTTVFLVVAIVLFAH
jgi:hypothetical protein